MLVEKKLSEALIDYTKGRKVIVLQIYENGEMDPFNLDSILNDERNHFLVDVPAYRNPEFEAAVQEMISNYTVQENESPAEEPAEEPKAFGGGVPEPMEGKTTRNVVEEMVRQGLTNSEIREKTGLSHQTVWSYAKDIRKQMESYVGKNKDKHKCKTCQYRGRDPKNVNACDYIMHVGHSRGCKAEDCDKYVKGDRLTGNSKLSLMEESNE